MELSTSHGSVRVTRSMSKIQENKILNKRTTTEREQPGSVNKPRDLLVNLAIGKIKIEEIEKKPGLEDLSNEQGETFEVPKLDQTSSNNSNVVVKQEVELEEDTFEANCDSSIDAAATSGHKQISENLGANSGTSSTALAVIPANTAINTNLDENASPSLPKATGGQPSGQRRKPRPPRYQPTRHRPNTSLLGYPNIGYQLNSLLPCCQLTGYPTYSWPPICPTYNLPPCQQYNIQFVQNNYFFNFQK